MSSYQRALWTLAVCTLFATLCRATSDNSTSTGAFDTALEPLYQMTDGFLRLVFPASGISVETLTKILDQTNEGVAASNAWPLTQTVLNGYYGFAACLVIGVLLLVLMPFIGCFCCCCRSCNKCGGKTYEHDPRHAKCKRLFCGALLLIFTLVLVGGMVMFFFSINKLHDITSADGAIAKQVQTRSAALSDVVNRTLEEDLKGQTLASLNHLEKDINDYLDGVGQTVTDKILQETNTADVAASLDALIGEVSQINSSMTSAKTYLDGVGVAFGNAEPKLTRANAQAQGLVGCADQNACDRLKNAAQAAEDMVKVSFATAIQDIENLRQRLDSVNGARTAFDQVMETVNTKINQSFDSGRTDVLTKVADAKGQVTGLVDNISNLLSPFLGSFDAQIGTGLQYLSNSDVQFAFDIQWKVALGLGSLVGLIALFYLLGLTCGCGERPGHGANCCNRGAGASLMLSGVGCTFIFFSLLMLLTVIMFSIGSLVTSHLCWTVQDPKPLVKALAENPIVIPTNNGPMKLNQYLGVYQGCLDDSDFEDVLRALGNQTAGFSRDVLFKKVMDNLDPASIDAIINGINIQTSDLNFLSTELTNKLNDLINLDFATYNLNDVITAVNKPLRSTVTALIDSTQVIKTQQQAQPSNVERLDKMLMEYTSVLNTEVPEVERLAENLNTTIIGVQSSTRMQTAAADLLNKLNDAQTKINNDGANIVREALRSLADDLVTLVNQTTVSTIDSIFGVRCKDLATSIQSLVDVACVTVFNPFNGIWFSLGWCLGMMIFALIISLFLASLYRRQLPYDKEYKSDELEYHGDNIPLESRPKYSYGYGDATNHGFRDDYGQALKGGSHSYYNGGHRPTAHY